MDDKELIAKRVALELRPGDLVNLGIGLPQSVANYLPAGVEVFFQSENGIIGMEALPEIGMEDPYLTDAGGRPVGAGPGACSFDSCISFGLIRGGHLDVTVLGGLQVDERGRLANWTIPGKMIPGMGGAMDLVTGTKRRWPSAHHKYGRWPLAPSKRIAGCSHLGARDGAGPWRDKHDRRFAKTSCRQEGARSRHR